MSAIISYGSIENLINNLKSLIETNEILTKIGYLLKLERSTRGENPVYEQTTYPSN
jgi:hypothetical protein